ncbi:Ubiquitin-conjugating enzyme E2 6 [Allomyces javanicus]|nr:Ubiquitin-conjugating enzyme E2 6 [Allomyces javanicus]
MAANAAFKRLTKEYKAIVVSPPPLLTARPLENNILEWHFLLHGPPDTPYHGGIYWGKLVFPPQYPYKPPSIRMLTPNGRFKPGDRICLSMSDFHPDTWNPAWSVATILSGLLSFMATDEVAAGTVAGTPSQRKALAAASHAWNREQKVYKEVFPEFCANEKPVFGGSYDAPPKDVVVAPSTPAPAPVPAPTPAPASPAEPVETVVTAAQPPAPTPALVATTAPAPTTPAAPAPAQAPSAPAGLRARTVMTAHAAADAVHCHPPARGAAAAAAAANGGSVTSPTASAVTTAAAPSPLVRYKWLVVAFLLWCYLFVSRIAVRFFPQATVASSAAA